MKRQRKKSSFFTPKKNDSPIQKKYKNTSEIKKSSENTRRIPSSEISAAAKKSKKTKKQHPFLKKLRTAIFMLIFVGVIVSCGIATGMYAAIVKEMKDMDIQNISMNYSSFVYCTDSLGNSHELEQLSDDGYRIWLEPNEIPDVMKKAAIAIEDERFYDHNGVDIKRTLGAFVNWTFEKLGGKKATYGGSTITQQVIKNITHEKDRTPMRKVKEMMRAVALEQELSKDEIITLYLNIIFLANNCYGVEAASNMYFDKNASELTLTEAALIAGITQRPSYFDPLKNPDNAIHKRNVVLSKMHELNMISDEEYTSSTSSDLGLCGNHKDKQSKIYSYFVDQVINDVINDLQTQKGYSETFARQQVLNGGLRIYTTMDNDIQENIESIFENTSNFPAAKKAQSAMIIIDPSNGEIKGMVGGKGKKTDSRGLNRATQTKRQPGSSFKPLSVYAPSIELKKITAATILNDEKITIGDWTPKNSYTGYKGAMPLRRALEISSNTVAVKTLQELTIDVSYNYLKNKFHISTLEDADKALSPLSLGGLTTGVTLKEIAAAYGVLANNGYYVKPHTYTKVIDNTGKLLLENQPEAEKVISADTAYIITSLLTSVVSGSNGTGKLAKLEEMPVAGKTGTTNNDYDKWFVGYTPYYVGAVWYGFDQPESIRAAGVTNNVSAKLWGQVMKKVHSELSVREFSKPSTVVEAQICTKTGKLASSGCSYSSTEYFISGTEPTKSCSKSHSGSSSKTKSTQSNKTAHPSVSPSTSTSDDSSVTDEIQNNDSNEPTSSENTPTHPPEYSQTDNTSNGSDSDSDIDAVIP